MRIKIKQKKKDLKQKLRQYEIVFIITISFTCSLLIVEHPLCKVRRKSWICRKSVNKWQKMKKTYWKFGESYKSSKTWEMVQNLRNAGAKRIWPVKVKGTLLRPEYCYVCIFKNTFWGTLFSVFYHDFLVWVLVNCKCWKLKTKIIHVYCAF